MVTINPLKFGKPVKLTGLPTKIDWLSEELLCFHSMPLW